MGGAGSRENRKGGRRKCPRVLEMGKKRPEKKTRIVVTRQTRAEDLFHLRPDRVVQTVMRRSRGANTLRVSVVKSSSNPWQQQQAFFAKSRLAERTKPHVIKRSFLETKKKNPE